MLLRLQVGQTKLKPNAKNQDGISAIHHCCVEELEQSFAATVLQYLIKNGGNVKDPMPNVQLTPLHIAVKFDHMGLVEILLDNGAKVDAKDAYGDSPIQLENGCPGMVELLSRKKRIKRKYNNGMDKANILPEKLRQKKNKKP